MNDNFIIMNDLSFPLWNIAPDVLRDILEYLKLGDIMILSQLDKKTRIMLQNFDYKKYVFKISFSNEYDYNRFNDNWIARRIKNLDMRKHIFLPFFPKLENLYLHQNDPKPTGKKDDLNIIFIKHSSEGNIISNQILFKTYNSKEIYDIQEYFK